MKNYKKNLLSGFLLVFALSSFGQANLKLDFFKHFKHGHRKYTNGYFKNPQIEMDVLGNTFVTISPTDYYEFESSSDTGSLLLLLKFDKNGDLKWQKKWKYTDLSFAAFSGLQADDEGGVWVSSPLSLSVKALIDGKSYTTFPEARTSFHFDKDGIFKEMAPLHFACTSELMRGLDGNFYSIGSAGELSSFDKNGKVALKYFKAYYNFSRPEFAIDADGDRAYISTENPGSRNMGDTIYSWSTSSHTLICFDSTGKVKWHRLISNLGYKNEAAGHRMRYDKQGNLYVATNFSRTAPGKSGLFSSGYRAIIYKFDHTGNLIGEFYDTANIGQATMSSEAWLYNDEQGRVNAVFYTFQGYNEQKYPNFTLPAEQSDKMLKVVFDSTFKVQQYFLGPNGGVPGNSMPSHKFCLFSKPNSTAKWFYLPDQTEITLLTNQDVIFMVLDSIGRPASTKNISKENVISIFPNPNNSNFKFALNTIPFNTLEASIYNSNGQLIFNQNLSKSPSGDYNISMPNSTPLPGIYILSIVTDNGIQYREKFEIIE